MVEREKKLIIFVIGLVGHHKECYDDLGTNSKKMNGQKIL